MTVFTALVNGSFRIEFVSGPYRYLMMKECCKILGLNEFEFTIEGELFALSGQMLDPSFDFLELTVSSFVNPLESAAWMGNVNAIRLWIRSGLPVDYKARNSKNTALSSAVRLIYKTDWIPQGQVPRTKKYEAIVELINLGADVNVIDCNGNSVLRSALRFHAGSDIEQLLIDHGATNKHQFQ
jgi:ankyrin repeat protein